MSGIEVFTPLVRRVVIDDTHIEIGPLKARQFAAVQKAMRPLAKALAAGDTQALIVDNLADTIALLAAATGKDEEWLAAREPDRLLDLFAEVVEVNLDFSRRRVRTALDRLEVKIAGLAKNGVPSSPISAESGTPFPSPST